jgi:hypothetical protein
VSSPSRFLWYLLTLYLATQVHCTFYTASDTKKRFDSFSACHITRRSRTGFHLLSTCIHHHHLGKERPAAYRCQREALRMLEDMEHTSRHVVPSERILENPWVDNDRGNAFSRLAARCVPFSITLAYHRSSTSCTDLDTTIDGQSHTGFAATPRASDCRPGAGVDRFSDTRKRCSPRVSGLKDLIYCSDSRQGTWSSCRSHFQGSGR